MAAWGGSLIGRVGGAAVFPFGLMLIGQRSSASLRSFSLLFRDCCSRFTCCPFLRSPHSHSLMVFLFLRSVQSLPAPNSSPVTRHLAPRSGPFLPATSSSCPPRLVP